MDMYTNMKGAFVHVWGEMGLLRVHLKLSRAHVIIITCAREVVAREVVACEREVTIICAHMKGITCARKKFSIFFSPCPLGVSVIYCTYIP